jgi:AraC family transcriptional regulator
LSRDFGARETPEFRANWALQDASLGNLVREMGREARSAWPLGTLYADLLALGFETQLLRRHAAGGFATPPLKGGLGLPKLRRAMEYMNANLAEDVRLEEVAEELDLSASHFAHEFRSSTGQTPYQYLLDQRITKAQNLLKSTPWSVQYIGAVTGFRAPANFVRAFRQRVGRSPAAWRRSS